jgi:hypothetical protein
MLMSGGTMVMDEEWKGVKKREEEREDRRTGGPEGVLYAGRSPVAGARSQVPGGTEREGGKARVARQHTCIG